MSYQIRFDPYARKNLGALDKPVRRRVLAKIEALATNPRPPGALMMTGRHGDYRLRVGDYRIIYTIQDAELIVLVIDVGHRREIYL